jgi:hypothetical protein
MARGGKRAGSGRRAGNRNKKTVEVLEGAAKGGALPLGYMLEVMRDPNADERRRDDMAKAAAPYLHPRRAGDPAHED